MAKNRTYKSDVSAAIHETASDLYEAGVIDKQMMQSFDESCLTPIREFTPEEIQALREREQVEPDDFCLLSKHIGRCGQSVRDPIP